MMMKFFLDKPHRILNVERLIVKNPKKHLAQIALLSAVL